MNITRILANAIVRRVAFCAVAAAAALLFGPDARAQAANPDCYGNSQGGQCATEEEAWANAKRACNYTANQQGLTCYFKEHLPAQRVVRFAFMGYMEFPYGRSWYAGQGCAADAPLDTTTGQCAEPPPDCDKPSFTTASAPRSAPYSANMTSGSLYCESLGTEASCTMAAFQNVDGTWTSEYVGGGTCTANSLKDECESMTGFYWQAGTSTCNAINETCDANQTKDPVTGSCNDSCPSGMSTGPDGSCKPDSDTCPAGEIKSPSGACLPGDGQCAAGEARKADGTCGIDANGDGEADADDDDPNNDPDEESFSGGDNCNNPPACSGSPILCGQARIQWRIECNTRVNENISGGACGAIPICTGEKCRAMEYSQLLMQWRTACALEKASSGDGEGDDAGTAEWLASQAAANKGEADALANAGDGHDGITGDEIWSSGIPTGAISETLFGGGGGGSCSAPTWNLLGHPIEVGADWWELASWIGFLLVAMSYIWVAWRLM